MVESTRINHRRSRGLMNDLLKLCWVVWLSLGTASMGQSQSGACSVVLTGRIMGLDNHEPLAGATVYIRGLAIGAVADSVGNFRITGLCQGKYIIDYQYVGYKASIASIAVGTDSPVALPPVALTPDNETLKEVIVTEHRSEAQQLLQVQTELAGSSLDATRGQSLGESLKTLPGLYSIQTGPSISKPVIHGLYSNRILTLNNGVRQEDQQWGSEHAPQIDPFLASRLTVIKGAASIRYGSDAIGG
jgi:iron complex outermembrane receptor protein